MLSSIIKENLNFQNENINKIQKTLNQIYEMLKSKKEKEAIKIFNNFISQKIKLNDIPLSLNLEGSLIMTFSKFWMIIILTSLSQLNNTNDKIKNLINLVNISFNYDLNERKEYKDFYDNLCEEYIKDKIAFNAINLNPYLENKLNQINDHLEIKKNYIYLLNKPHSFDNNFNYEIKLKSKEKIDNQENEDDDKKVETINSLKKISKKLTNKRKENQRKNKKKLSDSIDDENETDIGTKKSSFINKKTKNKNDKIKLSKKFIDDESDNSENENSSSDDDYLSLIHYKKRKNKRKGKKSIINLKNNNKKNILLKNYQKKNEKVKLSKNNKRRSKTNPKKSLTIPKKKLNKYNKVLKKKNDSNSSIINNDNKSDDENDLEKEKNVGISEIDESLIKELYDNYQNKNNKKNKKKRISKSFNDDDNDDNDEDDENISFSSIGKSEIDYGKYIDIDSDKIDSLLCFSDFNNSKLSE